jgi:four helix bundle protein
MRDIREFVCWQLADELKRQILDLTSSGPASQDFRFRDQIRESSASATANMAEGFRYFEPAQFARFLRYAVGSLGETEDRLLDAFDRKMLDEKRYHTLNNLAGAARRATTNLMLSKQRQAATEKTHTAAPTSAAKGLAYESPALSRSPYTLTIPPALSRSPCTLTIPLHSHDPPALS